MAPSLVARFVGQGQYQGALPLPFLTLASTVLKHDFPLVTGLDAHTHTHTQVHVCIYIYMSISICTSPNIDKDTEMDIDVR